MKDEIFGSFFLNSNEFAISVKSVQEVVNEPQSYSPMPLAPDYLIGLFNLRGTIVPVIDLNQILQLSGSPKENGTEKKIAIIEHGEFCVGLRFDRTSEVFKGLDSERSTFDGVNDKHSKVVEGVFKLNQGKRIVQVLSPEAIISLDRLPQSQKSSRTAIESQTKTNQGPRMQAISFVVGDSKCALEMDSIQEIISIDKIDSHALATEKCIGAFNLRNQTVPLVDFGSILGYREPDRSPDAINGDRRVVIMKNEQGLFGLLVDSIQNIVPYFQDELLPFPVFGKARQEMFLGCIAKDSNDSSENIILLDHKEVLSNDEINEVTRGNSNLYQHNATGEELKETSIKKTYITFSLGNQFAVDINEVREVIECPDELLQPPGLAKQFHGVLNLRGDMVAIVDSRKLYQLPPTKESSSSESKVLIFETDGTKYGLVVDSVNSIVQFGDSDKIKLPELLYRDSTGKMAEDVEDAVEIETQDNERKTLLVLQMSSVSNRIAA